MFAPGRRRRARREVAADRRHPGTEPMNRDPEISEGAAVAVVLGEDKAAVVRQLG